MTLRVVFDPRSLTGQLAPAAFARGSYSASATSFPSLDCDTATTDKLGFVALRCRGASEGESDALIHVPLSSIVAIIEEAPPA